ncbi:hypothetical protein ACMDCR_03995 [Labrys okinawensis]|uniref:hypothetical protein n=1 Tax=Labrys okinawensis TaxID=346911 RepID=UPI0039BD8A4A
MRTSSAILIGSALLLASCVSDGGYDEKGSRYDDNFRANQTYADRERDNGVCEPEQALRQARRAGLSSAGIRQVTPQFVIAGGQRDDGDDDEVTLINRSGCPYARE